jgi:hypothetical protein
MSWNLKRWTVCGIALVCFSTGSLLTARLSQIEQVRTDSSRVFELRIYHALPGKLPVMESRFRDTTSKLLARHNLDVVGYWTGEGAPGSGGTFIFLLAHRSRQEANRNWKLMETDPEFQRVIKSEQAEKTLANADVIYMKPTDFSPLK